MFWASSYNLFVTWSVNGQHPWDNLPNASKPAATLEIGSLRGTNKVQRPKDLPFKAMNTALQISPTSSYSWCGCSVH